MLVRSLPRDAATNRSLAGDDVIWGLAEHLAAATVDALHAGNWQRGGGKGAKPKPIPRPGTSDKTITKIGGKKKKRRTIPEMREFLDSKTREG